MIVEVLIGSDDSASGQMDGASTERAAHDAVQGWAREVVRISDVWREGIAAQVDQKTGPFDLVSEADRSIERSLVNWIRNRFPHHGITGEEGSWEPSLDGWRWVVDPIDGTYNWVTRLPFCACSVALLRDDDIVVGAVADLSTGLVVSARRGDGVHVDPPDLTAMLPVRDRPGVDRLLVEMGGEGLTPQLIELLSRLSTIRPFVLRQLGSAALALVTVARSGGLFVGVGLRLWDVAAGLVVASEAGLTVRRWSDGDLVHVLAGRPDDVHHATTILAGLIPAVRDSVADPPEGSVSGR